MQFITTDAAPRPAGHYSQAVVHNGCVYVAGILRAAGSDVDHVLKVTIYVSDLELWGGVNEAFAAFFGDHRPARAIVPTRDLHFGALLEVDAIAAVRS